MYPKSNYILWPESSPHIGTLAPKYTVEAQKLETQLPQSLRVMYRKSQHYLALIRFPTLWGSLYTTWTLRGTVRDLKMIQGTCLRLIYSEPPESWSMALGGLVLGSLILYLKGMRIMMFQLSGFYCNSSNLLF